MYYYQFIIAGALTFIVYIAYTLITLRSRKNIIKKKRHLKGDKYFSKKSGSMDTLLMDSFKNSELDEKFKSAGLPLTSNQYNLIRAVVVIICLAVFASSILQGDHVLARKSVLYAILIYTLTLPVAKLGKINTPFGLFIKNATEGHQTKVNFELYNVITQLRNLILSQGTHQLSADFILNQINMFTHDELTKPIFSQMLKFWRENKEEEAKTFFKDAIPTKLGREFGNLLVKLDSIDPMELIGQLENLQDEVRQSKITAANKSQKSASSILFLLANIGAILVMFDLMGNVMGSISNGFR